MAFFVRNQQTNNRVCIDPEDPKNPKGWKLSFVQPIKPFTSEAEAVKMIETLKSMGWYDFTWFEVKDVPVKINWEETDPNEGDQA